MRAPLPLETKRAFFRAQVIAIESGQNDVDSISVLAALFVSPTIVSACEQAGFSVAELIACFGVGDSLRSLQRAESSLAAANIVFGSREHIESLTQLLRPLAKGLLRIVQTKSQLTVLDVLEAVIHADHRIGHSAEELGLTVEALRAVAQKHRDE